MLPHINILNKIFLQILPVKIKIIVYEFIQVGPCLAKHLHFRESMRKLQSISTDHTRYRGALMTPRLSVHPEFYLE